MAKGIVMQMKMAIPTLVIIRATAPFLLLRLWKHHTQLTIHPMVMVMPAPVNAGHPVVICHAASIGKLMKKTRVPAIISVVPS